MTAVNALSIRDVCKKTSLSRATVYAHIAAGVMPRPAHISGRSIWKEAEIDAWLEARFAERDAQAVAA
jgi:predicted DNA-binding transcriptional regulator AlpA